MKAWKLDRLGGRLHFGDAAVPQVRPGTVLVCMEASVLMSYLRDYVGGRLPAYRAPPTPFVPGGSGVGIVAAVGDDVWHLRPGQRVVVSAHVVADENVDEPGRFLLGVTANGAVAEVMQASFPDGVLADYALVPKSTVTPVVGLDGLSAVRLATTTRFLVPFGGLLRGRLATGETVVVVGATGAYGSAAVLVALALGAERVVAAGRRRDALACLVEVAGPRVVPVALGGDVADDTAALRAAAGGGAHLALDLVGSAKDPNATLAGLGALRSRGRLVLMGSMTAPLPVPYLDLMLTGREVIGNFMYPADAPRRLLALIRAELLDSGALAAQTFPLAALPAAMDAAATAMGPECVVVTYGDEP